MKTLLSPLRVLRFLAHFIKRYFEKGRFTPATWPVLSFETTNICNSDCIFCANSVMQRKKMYIDKADFKATVKAFAKAGGKEIDFNATIGDPLLDKNLLARARYVREYPQFESLGFVTTLQWLHKHDLEEFIRLFTWVGVSITLSGPESYRKFFGVDKYKIALSNLKILLRTTRGRQASFFVGIGLKPTDDRDDDILSHPDFIEINGLLGGRLTEQVRQRTYFVDDWSGAVQLPPYLKKRPLYPRAFRPCSILYNRMMVFSNGKVSACSCRDFEAASDLILGDIRNDNIMDLWQGHRLAAIRRNWRLKNQVPDICKSCRHYVY